MFFRGKPNGFVTKFLDPGSIRSAHVRDDK